MTLKRTLEPSQVSLDLGTLRRANLARLPLFKNAKGEPAHSQPDGSDWSRPEWCNAVLGELGELANLLKKVQRRDMTMDEARPDIAKELADVQTYLDILAHQCGVDLGKATIEKFNAVSERVRCNVRIYDARTWGFERTCPYPGCDDPYRRKPPCALCYE